MLIFTLPSHCFDCYRSSSPACSASCQSHGRKRTNSNLRHSFSGFSLRIPATPSRPRPHVRRPTAVDTPRKREMKRISLFRARTTTTSSAKAQYSITTQPPKLSTSPGEEPPPGVPMATILIRGIPEAPWGRHIWTSTLLVFACPQVYAHTLTHFFPLRFSLLVLRP